MNQSSADLGMVKESQFLRESNPTQMLILLFKVTENLRTAYGGLFRVRHPRDLE
jgi:hypothetical protein